MKTVYETAKTKMGKTIHALEVEYGAIRAGRANPQVLDRVTVDYYGTPTPINQLASVSATEARVLTIQPWDKSVLKAIEKAIQTSDIGINPNNDGTVIRTRVCEISTFGRVSQGVIVMRLSDDAKLVNMTVVPAEEETDAGDEDVLEEGTEVAAEETAAAEAKETVE